VLATVKEGTIIYGSYPSKRGYLGEAQNIKGLIDEDAVKPKLIEEMQYVY
jgi:hypothetical protein